MGNRSSKLSEHRSIIDHRNFPEIIDLIFDYAFPDSYLVLRHVCREWRADVLAYFCHLELDSENFELSYIDLISPFYVAPLKITSGPERQALRYCRHIDVDARYNPSPTTVTPLFPNLDTIRFIVPPSGKVHLPDVPTVVFMDKLHDFEGFEFAADSGIRKLVFNRCSVANTLVGCREAGAVQSLNVPPRLEEIVYIWHPEEPRPDPEALNSVPLIFLLWEAAIRSGVPFTMVGFEDVEWIGPAEEEEGFLGGVQFEDGLLRVLAPFAERITGHGPNFVSDLTNAEYRERVGDAIFELETDCNAVVLGVRPLSHAELLRQIPETWSASQ